MKVLSQIFFFPQVLLVSNKNFSLSFMYRYFTVGKVYYKNLNLYLGVLMQGSNNFLIQLIEQLRNIDFFILHQLGFILLVRKANSQLKLPLTINNKFPQVTEKFGKFWISSKSWCNNPAMSQRSIVAPSLGSVLHGVCLIRCLAPDPRWLLLSRLHVGLHFLPSNMEPTWKSWASLWVNQFRSDTCPKPITMVKGKSLG